MSSFGRLGPVLSESGAEDALRIAGRSYLISKTNLSLSPSHYVGFYLFLALPQPLSCSPGGQGVYLVS